MRSRRNCGNCRNNILALGERDWLTALAVSRGRFRGLSLWKYIFKMTSHRNSKPHRGDIPFTATAKHPWNPSNPWSEIVGRIINGKLTSRLMVINVQKRFLRFLHFLHELFMVIRVKVQRRTLLHHFERFWDEFCWISARRAPQKSLMQIDDGFS